MHFTPCPTTPMKTKSSAMLFWSIKISLNAPMISRWSSRSKLTKRTASHLSTSLTKTINKKSRLFLWEFCYTRRSIPSLKSTILIPHSKSPWNDDHYLTYLNFIPSNFTDAYSNQDFIFDMFGISFILSTPPDLFFTFRLVPISSLTYFS